MRSDVARIIIRRPENSETGTWKAAWRKYSSGVWISKCARQRRLVPDICALSLIETAAPQRLSPRRGRFKVFRSCLSQKISAFKKCGFYIVEQLILNVVTQRESHMKNFLAQVIVGMGLLVSFTQTVSAQWIRTNGPYGGGYIQSLAKIGSTIIAGSGNGIFISTNNGTSWTAIDSGLVIQDAITSLAMSGNNLFAGTDCGVFLSTNNGTRWTAVSSGLPQTIYYGYTQQIFTYVNALAVSGQDLFAGTNYGVYLSTNNGASWTAVDSDLTPTVNALAVSDNAIFAGTANLGIYRSTNNGTSWTAVDSGITDSAYVFSLAVSGNNIFAGTSNGVFLSTNNGTSWKAVDSGLPSFTYVNALAVSGNTIFAGMSTGIFVSTNKGTSWTAIDAGLTETYILSLAASGDTIFAGSDGNGVFLSTNNGAHWSAVGLPIADVRSLAVSGGTIFAGSDFGVSFSINNGASWSVVDSVNGVSWSAGDSMLINTWVNALAVSDNSIFAGTFGEGIFRSTNNGTSWTALDSGLGDSDVQCLAVNGKNIFAGTPGGVFLSTNNGTSWTAETTGLPGNITFYDVYCLAVSGNNIFAGTYDGGVFLSTNNGKSWTAVNSGLTIEGISVNCLTVSGNSIFAGTEGGVFLSTNNGTSWTGLGSSGPSEVNALAVSGNNIFAGNHIGIWLLTNNGPYWTLVDSGLTDAYCWSLAVRGDTLFAGTDRTGVWYRPIPEMTTGVINDKPQRAMLNQENLSIRSPNHGSSDATIEFSLPHSDKVTVTVYNLSGHQIASLVNKIFSQGSHSITWNTRNLAAGCYTVRLRTGSNTYVKSVPIFR